MSNPRTSRSRREAVKQGYRSALEMQVANQLKKARIAFEYEPRDSILEYKQRINNVVCESCGCTNNIYQVRTYLPDFVIGNVVLEAKGRWVASDRSKINNLVQSHRGVTFVMLFQNPNQKTSKKRGTYAEWCDKNGILWLGYNDPSWITKLKTIIKDSK